jgi:hypothetical protein
VSNLILIKFKYFNEQMIITSINLNTIGIKIYKPMKTEKCTL